MNKGIIIILLRMNVSTSDKKRGDLVCPLMYSLSKLHCTCILQLFEGKREYIFSRTKFSQMLATVA